MRQKRLAWAMKHSHWTTEDWKKVLCLRVGERMALQCVASTVKHRGESVMVCGCFTGSRISLPVTEYRSVFNFTLVHFK